MLKRKMLVEIVKTELEYERLIDLLAQDFIQHAANDLKETIEQVEKETRQEDVK